MQKNCYAQKLQRHDGDHIYTMQSYTDNRVKLHGWQSRRESLPKDNDPYMPPCGDYFLSTYNRWGWSPDLTRTSETHDMLRQIELRKKLEYLELIKPRPMVNFLSYDPTNEESRRQDLEESGLPQYPADYGQMDYTSTMKRDYTPQNPLFTKPVSIPPQHPMVNRISISELNDGLTLRRRGVNTFMDDNAAEYRAINKLRCSRGHVTFDPCRKAYTYANCLVSPAACDGKYDIKQQTF